jgi:hypothetical protein
VERGRTQVLSFVVADELDPLTRLVGQHPLDQTDHGLGIRPTMDEVADLHEGEVGRKAQRVRIRAEADQLSLELVPVPADITDNGHPSHHPRSCCWSALLEWLVGIRGYPQAAGHEPGVITDKFATSDVRS